MKLKSFTIFTLFLLFPFAQANVKEDVQKLQMAIINLDAVKTKEYLTSINLDEVSAKDWTDILIVADSSSEPIKNVFLDFFTKNPLDGKLNAMDDLNTSCSRAVLYKNGWSNLPKKRKEAFRLFQLAAENGHSQSQFKLAQMYEDGQRIGLPDRQKALSLYKLSAEQGYAEAQYKLARMYFNGIGVLKDKNEGLRLYKRSADQGYVEAQYELACIFLSNNNYAETLRLLKLSADQGYSRSLYAHDFTK